MSFPCSNAQVERIFSSLKLIKSEKRSSMRSETLVALTYTRYALKLSSQSVANNLDNKTLHSLLADMEASGNDSESAD